MPGAELAMQRRSDAELNQFHYIERSTVSDMLCQLPSVLGRRYSVRREAFSEVYCRDIAIPTRSIQRNVTVKSGFKIVDEWLILGVRGRR